MQQMRIAYLCQCTSPSTAAADHVAHKAGLLHSNEAVHIALIPAVTTEMCHTGSYAVLKCYETSFRQVGGGTTA